MTKEMPVVDKGKIPKAPQQPIKALVERITSKPVATRDPVEIKSDFTGNKITKY